MSIHEPVSKQGTMEEALVMCARLFSSPAMACRFAHRMVDSVKTKLLWHGKDRATDKERAFLVCEEATWTLVSLLAEAQTHSPSVVWHYFNIKQWLEKSTVATAMAYSDSEDDQEHEIPDTNLNKKKRHLKRALAKRRRISVHASLDEFEAFNKSLLRHLRHHRLEKALEESEAKEEPWRKALLRAYADTMDRVKEGQSVHWTADGRTAWRETCHALANQTDIGPYSKAMYSVLSGKTEHLLPLCETWEDVMWAHTNACLQDTIDQWEGSSVPSRHLQGDAPCLFMAESARQKDMLLDSSDPIIFFHWVQEAFLMNTLSNVIDLLYQVCVQGQWDKVGCVRENPSLHRTFLRFAAGVVLYARSHLSETSEKGDLLLVFYARSIGTSSLESMVYYASLLSPKHQSMILSYALKDNVKDKEMCASIIRLGKKYALNISELSRHSFVLLMKEFTDTPTPPQETGMMVFAVDTPDSMRAQQLLEALALVDVNRDANAFSVFNGILRYLLATHELSLAKVALRYISHASINQQMLSIEKDSLKTSERMVELEGHRLVVGVLEMYATWKTLRQSFPIDEGTVDSLSAVQTWRRDFMNMTRKLHSDLLVLLESAWLKDAVTEEQVIRSIDWIGNEGLDLALLSNQALRKTYVPEMVLCLYYVLYNTRDLFKEHDQKCIDLVNFVSQERTDIYKDMAAAKKTGLFLKVVCESQMAMF